MKANEGSEGNVREGRRGSEGRVQIGGEQVTVKEGVRDMVNGVKRGDVTDKRGE